MMTKRKKLQIAGLFLWNIRLEGCDSHLWITTRVSSMVRAIEKAQKFIDKSDEFAGNEIKAVIQHGTIDA